MFHYKPQSDPDHGEAAYVPQCIQSNEEEEEEETAVLALALASASQVTSSPQYAKI